MGAQARTELAWIVDDDPNDRFPIWTRGNVGEVFPSVVTPLTWSAFGEAAERGWRDAFARLGVLRERDYGTVFPSIIGSFGGTATSTCPRTGPWRCARPDSRRMRSTARSSGSPRRRPTRRRRVTGTGWRRCA